MVAVVLAATVAIVAGACSGSSAAKDHYNRAVQLLDGEKSEEAIAELDQAIELDPEFSLAYVARGNAHFDLEQYEPAIVDFTKAIELAPDSALAYGNRGSAYAATGQNAQAKADYEKALPLASDPALLAQIRQGLDFVATAWPVEWEDGVCGAYAELREEVDARGSALDKAMTCPETGDCTDAALGAEEAAGHAARMITLLEGVPSWPPGQPWVDNLMTQAIGYRDVSRAMAGAFRASEGGDPASLMAALALGTKAKEQATYLAAQEASNQLREVLRNVYEATGFLCPE